MWSGKGGTQAREDARVRYLGLEGNKRWKICCWAHGAAGLQRAEHTSASAGGIPDRRGEAQSGISGKAEEDLKQRVVTAPRKDQGGGGASQGAWGIEARERDGPEGLGTEETVVGASRPHQARG